MGSMLIKESPDDCYRDLCFYLLLDNLDLLSLIGDSLSQLIRV